VSLKNSERNNKLTREEASPLETRALFIWSIRNFLLFKCWWFIRCCVNTKMKGESSDENVIKQILVWTHFKNEMKIDFQG
jgi:hypothetical protein